MKTSKTAELKLALVQRERAGTPREKRRANLRIAALRHWIIELGAAERWASILTNRTEAIA